MAKRRTLHSPTSRVRRPTRQRSSPSRRPRRRPNPSRSDRGSPPARHHRRRTRATPPSHRPPGETHREPAALMGLVRTRPSRELLSGASADVYFARAESVLEREGLDPIVTMEVFARQDAVLCGIDEVKNLLAHALELASPDEAVVEALDDGDTIGPKEVVL